MDRLSALQHFVAVAEQGGFAKAALKLRSSPPAVTRTIAGLERHLGVQLLTRTTRRVHLTEAGQHFLPRVRQLLADLEAAEADAAGRGTRPTGRLRISASVTMGRILLPSVVASFRTAQPLVSLELLLVDRMVDLVEEGVDVALRIARLPSSTLVARPIGQVSRVLVASPAYLDRRGVPAEPEALTEHEIVAFTGLMPDREWRWQRGQEHGRVALRPWLEVNDAAAAIELAEVGQGITLALSYMVGEQLAAGRLVPVLAAFGPAPVPVQLVYPESRLLAPKVRAFVDHAAPRLRAALVTVGQTTLNPERSPRVRPL